jgi:hypothetical protein
MIHVRAGAAKNINIAVISELLAIVQTLTVAGKPFERTTDKIMQGRKGCICFHEESRQDQSRVQF